MSFIVTGTPDWKLLRQQKLHLLEILDDKKSNVTAEQRQSIEGLINFLDSVQDAAVTSKLYTEEDVFGKEISDAKAESVTP